MRLSSTLSCHILKIAVVHHSGDSTTSQGRLFQWLVVLTIKNFFLMSRWNLSWCNLYCCPLSSPCYSLWRKNHNLLCSCLLSAKILLWGPPQTFFREKGPKSFSLSLKDRLSSLLIIFMSPALDPLQSVCIFLKLWRLEQDAVLQVQPDKHWIKWDDRISVASCNAPEDRISIWFAFAAAMGHSSCSPCCSPGAQVLFSRTAPQLYRPSLYWVLWLFCPRCKTVKLHI